MIFNGLEAIYFHNLFTLTIKHANYFIYNFRIHYIDCCSINCNGFSFYLAIENKII